MSFVLIMLYISVYIGLVATTFYVLGYHSEKKKEKMLFTDDELPLVSIIIPAYNEEKSIVKTINSIVASDYPKGKLEILVVDDGSKDRTLELARKCKSKLVKVYTKPNGGKGTTLNFALKKCKGEIIFSMDADTFVAPHSVREMVRYFKNPEVMSVSPSMLIYQPRGVLQRIQQAEYLFGLFIRKAFASVNAVHVTPGAFSAYRKTFFDKYGGYDEGNITEDLEMSLRIQYHGYTIEYSPESPAYTIAPNKIKALTIQRRRWYAGLMRNTWKYKGIFSPKYGDLGLFVLPIAWISIFFSVFVINYLVIDTLLNLKSELLFLNKVNFDFASLFSVGSYAVERVLFHIFSNPIIIFFLFFVVLLGIYMKFATKKVGKVKGIPLTIALYFLFFAILFGFWWTVSIIYIVLNKKVSWR
ncbi:MAG: glycosyltransferase family 2 protein [archaeon]|nr:glycosyltransferase family 2 protein [archaeon]MCR4324025.1 glycosyltransferase family 2 protein [Nanoarchaeota archaeon]